jgi:replicative DNA helicase
MSLVSVEAECAVLGAVLTGAWCDEAEELRLMDFGEPRHALVWAVVLWLREKGRAVQLPAVVERLRAVGHLEQVGGPAWLMGLDEGGMATLYGVGMPGYIATIRDRASRRAVAASAEKAARSARNLAFDVTRTALEASGELAELGSAGESTDFTFRDALSDFNDRQALIQAGQWQQYQPTYIDIWDEMLAGLERGKLILIGAYPGVGKSALEAAVLLARAQRGHRDGIFTLEDPKLWLAKRYVARETGIPVRRLMQSPAKDGSGGLNKWQMDKVAAAYSSAEPWWDHMRIDERPGLTPHQIAAKSRMWVTKHKVESIWVDNASEVTLDDEGNERHDLRTASMVRCLRNVAKTLDIPVVLLVHFKRPKGNVTKEPRFIRPTSDLWKNAGAFEEASRVAVGLWQDEGMPGGIVGTILKQSEGAKDVDFWMPMVESAGLVNPMGGYVVGEKKGYSEGEAA